MVWVGSCTQMNMISAIEHQALMLGYAKHADRTETNTQKFNCHKILEFGVGLPMDAHNFGNLVDLDRLRD